jgi:hypothetical protein
MPASASDLASEVRSASSRSHRAIRRRAALSDDATGKEATRFPLGNEKPRPRRVSNPSDSNNLVT